jgi:hypothetical protein
MKLKELMEPMGSLATMATITSFLVMLKKLDLEAFSLEKQHSRLTPFPHLR